ncbi:hypothetical protein ACFL3C_03370 [Patescibacteria group bacterium]
MQIIMKTIKKIIVTLTLISVITTAAPIANAQNTGKELFCQRDWASFISSVISYDSFSEYWKDMFYRYNKNICYYTDIDNILQQVEKAQEQIRNAFYTCDAARATQLKTRYYELEAELFFLRNFVDISKSEIKTVPDKKIHEALRGNFVIGKSYFTEERSTELFEQFKQKYGKRVATTYKECSDPGLEALTKKFKDLKKSFQNMASGKTGTSLKDYWNKSLNTPVKRTGNFLGGVLDARINGLPPKEAVDNIYKEVQKSLPPDTPPTLNAVQNAIAKEEDDYAAKLEKASLLAEYEALYKNGTDSMAKDFEAKLKQLDSIIKGTYPAFNSLIECSKKAKDKQCK